VLVLLALILRIETLQRALIHGSCIWCCSGKELMARAHRLAELVPTPERDSTSRQQAARILNMTASPSWTPRSVSDRGGAERVTCMYGRLLSGARVAVTDGARRFAQGEAMPRWAGHSLDAMPRSTSNEGA